jgi:membrane associated rhomboid family serine protease
LQNRSALFFLGTWFGINLLVGLVSQPLGIAEGGIAWQAHIGGLLAGLLVFPLLDPVGRSTGSSFR